MGENTSKQPKEEGNDSQDLEQDLTALDDLESELSDLPEEEPLEINSDSKETSRQSRRARALWTLYPGRITYGSAPISRRLVDNSTQSSLNLNTAETPSSLERFTSTRVAQSPIHMVQTLRMLESNVDNKGDDEPNSLNQAMHRTDWFR